MYRKMVEVEVDGYGCRSSETRDECYDPEFGTPG